MKLTLLRAAACLALFGSAALAHAQTYPTKTITMIVPFAAGGPTDTVARLVAQSMGNKLKQQIIIENVGGAGGTIGAARVAKAAPDGYTLFLHHIGQSTAPGLYRKLSYNAIDSFEPIGLITDVPMTLVARKDFPAKDMKEFLAYVKANKSKVLNKQKDLLDQRYDLGDQPSNAKMSGGRKAVQKGVRVKLPKGMTWEKLAQMSPDEIREQGLLPAGFLPLPHVKQGP